MNRCKLVSASACVSFRKVVFEHDKYFPFVAIRIAHPSLVLNRVATVRLHLVSRKKAGVAPLLLHPQYIVRRCDLNAKMRKRAATGDGRFIQSQVQWRIMHVKFRIARSYLTWLNAEQLAIELDALARRFVCSVTGGPSVP